MLTVFLQSSPCVLDFDIRYNLMVNFIPFISRNVTHFENPNILVSFLSHNDLHKHIGSRVF